MKTITSLLFISVFLSLSLWAKPALNIALVTDGEKVTDREFTKKIKLEISQLLRNDYDVNYKLYQSDENSYLRIATHVNHALNNKNMDIVITLGTLSSHYGARKNRYSRPLIAVSVIDKELQRLPFVEGTSGKKNLNYFEHYVGIDEDIKQMKSLMDVKNVTVLMESSLLRYSPSVAKKIEQKMTQNDINVTVIGVPKDYDATIEALSDHTDLVYLLPLRHLDKSERKELYSTLRLKELATYSVAGVDEVTLGAMLSATPKFNSERIARNIALNIQQIKSGFNASELSVDLDVKKVLSINMATADVVNFIPSWEQLSKALLIEQKSSESHYFTIDNIITRALNFNLGLIAAQYSQELKHRQTQLADSVLLPQIRIQAGAQQIDDDRAEASLGTLDATSVAMGLNFYQSIYTQQQAANVEIKRSVADAGEEEINFLKQDISLAASLNYLQILQLEDELKIKKINYTLSEDNLRAAKVRQSLGSSSNGDIYRWESKIANDKRAVIQTHSQVQTSRIRLNALLDLKQTLPLNFSRIDEKHPIFLTSKEELMPYFEEPRRFRVLEEFLVEEGIRNAPELKQYHLLMDARSRLVESNYAAFYAPDIYLKGDILGRLSSSSSKTVELSPELQALPKSDDVDWNVGFFLEFPLYTGGAKDANYEAAKVALLATQSTARQQRNDIEQQIRDSLYKAKASYLSTTLSHTSYVAAKKNYELMQSIYAQGGTTIIHLLDAQNNMLTAALIENNTYYKFLLDVLRMQRKIGKVNFNVGDEEFSQWFSRLEEFAEENKKIN
jgi:outer membrane protein